ncbi:MAG TPA: DUF481 domain-containing protein [Bryobacteraceae bacterium]|nr:DUF481 domain-containing protein [Bryobacteraceae bacterium]
MSFCKIPASLPLFPIVLAAVLHAAPATPPPDVLILNSGEKLIGHLVNSSGQTVKFKSQALGDVTLEWNKIKEFQSSRSFAVIPRDVDPRRPEGIAEVVHGELSMKDQKLVVSGPVALTIPVGESEHVIEDKAFQKAIGSQPSGLDGWKGALTGGVALVEATQDSRTLTGSLNLTRVTPEYDWMDPRNRMTLNMSGAYGKVTQPNTPTLKTAIYHADGERDEYFSPRWFGFGRLSYDHNFSQGLDLAQNYGGGIGWTVMKQANQELDLKGSVSYIRQDFSGAPTDDLVGNTAAETFNRKFAHGVLLSEQVSFVGALNKQSAYSASGEVKLIMPLYKKLNFTISTTDNFLNDPPPGFRKNSFQFVTGVTYALK